MMKENKLTKIVLQIFILTVFCATSIAHAQFAPPSVHEQTINPEYEYVTQQVYVAMHGRAADRASLASFANSLYAIGAPKHIVGLNQAYDTSYQVRTLIDNLGNSDEFRWFNSSDTGTFITVLYQTLFNRQPDINGFHYWKALIDNGSVTRGRAAVAIMASSYGSSDGNIVEQKVQYAVIIDRELVWNYQIAAYSNAVQSGFARTLLANITHWHQIRPAVDAMVLQYR